MTRDRFPQALFYALCLLGCSASAIGSDVQWWAVLMSACAVVNAYALVMTLKGKW